ncbi:P-loop NTPase fold protein [Geodermatophilus sp. SYSU D00867]
MTAAEPFQGHIVPDIPAEDPAFRFGSIAAALAGIVQSGEPRFAVGIFGGWGSGKSTLMNEIERLVRLNQPRAGVVQFNAWRYEREVHLIVPLLDTIRASLAEWANRQAAGSPDAERVRSIAQRIGRVVRALARATSLQIGVPGGVALTVEPGKALDELNPVPDDTMMNAQSLYFAAFQELSQAFGEVQRAGLSRIIVFVDDLDRCFPERALTVLESMKLFFDMPGFVFVVGLDERVVEAAVRSKFAQQSVVAEEDAEENKVQQQIERDYLKKMFQVPYTLPAIAPGQLDELLRWLDDHGGLSDVQREDLSQRVRGFLAYVATEGQINPREVKRYINAYTLHRMISPDLDADTMLAVQTLDFRRDWEALYESVVLVEPDLFIEALVRYRKGDDHAFEDLWPDVGVLSLELSTFLRSAQCASLAATRDLARYVSLVETTRSSQSWVTQAMQECGQLRRLTREVRPPMRMGSTEARDRAVHLKDVLGRLRSYVSAAQAVGLVGSVEKLIRLCDELADSPESDGSAAPDVDPAPDVGRWQQRMLGEIDRLQQALRFIRRSSAFGTG